MGARARSVDRINSGVHACARRDLDHLTPVLVRVVESLDHVVDRRNSVQGPGYLGDGVRLEVERIARKRGRESLVRGAQQDGGSTKIFGASSTHAIHRHQPSQRDDHERGTPGRRMT